MGSVETNEKLAGFNLIQTHYKQIGDHAIRADFIIPKSTFTGKRPVIVRFHGGGLVTGDSLLMEWLPIWLLQLAKKHDAVIVSPNYRLLPESTSPEIFSDIEDFWVWLHSSAVTELLATSSAPTQLDLDRILTAGDSAGGLLSICVGLAHADEVRATAASYPMVDMASEYFRTATSSEPLPDVPASTVEDYLAQMDRSAIRSSAFLPDRFDLMVAAIYYGALGQFYEDGAEGSPRELRYPLEWLDRPDVKIPRGGIAILHGLQDAVVPVEQSEKFVEKAREVMKGRPGGDKVILTLREGDHGFDVEASLEEEWLSSHLKQAVEAWLE
ncbi:probable carboxylesterase 6 [Aspergillus udagawae]|uniref:Probable carboxylesterase 6 n=1 Tax=Aspergillus udagawae TaxID=91492 RepID=A0ABQ1BEQ1_9EURO|nr:probable carboxylesterase 6 [Aspergillus udagawae]GFG00153.1 probable carboxylesterase 6 [Aspergillus udagawae]